MCDKCVIGNELLAKDSNEFHFTSENAPVFETEKGYRFVVLKVPDPNIQVNAEAFCAVDLCTKDNSGLMSLGFPCYKCGNRVYVGKAPEIVSKS